MTYHTSYFLKGKYLPCSVVKTCVDVRSCQNSDPVLAVLVAKDRSNMIQPPNMFLLDPYTGQIGK